MANHSHMKGGKKPPVLDPRRRLKLAKFLPDQLPPPPECVDWTGGHTDFGMMLNDNIGDCPYAAAAHAVQTWTLFSTGTMDTIPDAAVEALYGEWAGYDPKNPSTDMGDTEVNVLNRWRQLGFYGHPLLGYVDPDPGDFLHVKQSIYLFGGLYIGLQLPMVAQDQEIWDFTKNDGGNWCGHAVWVPRYTPEFLTCITWRYTKDMTWDFFKHYCDESHTLLSLNWIKSTGFSPSSFDFARLQAGLSLVQSTPRSLS